MAMSPRRRARVIRWVQYAVLVVAVAAFLVFADLATLRDVFFDRDLRSRAGTATRRSPRRQPLRGI